MSEIKPLNRRQLQAIFNIAATLPPFSNELSEVDLLRHTLVDALIGDDGVPEVPATVRQVNIIQGRFNLLMDIDTTKSVTDDHMARLEYFAKEVWREVGLTESEIKAKFDD